MNAPAVRLDVLAIDRSALVRNGVVRALEGRGARVRVAADAAVAVSKMRDRRPDVVMLDIERPGGPALVESLLAQGVGPIASACGLVPSALALRLVAGGRTRLLPDVRFDGPLDAAWADRVLKALAPMATLLEPRLDSQPRSSKRGAPSPERYVAIGGSTGATEALEAVLVALPDDAPPIVAAIHMPAEFTGAFAARLDSLCRVAVREATDGYALTRGTVLVAPGGCQTRLVACRDGICVSVRADGNTGRYRPGVDILFESFANVVGDAGIGVILTGMGEDGVQGMRAMRDLGALTIAQDEASCAVFGMPMRAIRGGAASLVLPLDAIAARIALP